MIHFTRCWACITMQCPGGSHDWADADDIEHAAKNGYPSPVGSPCACTCVDGPALEVEPDEPEWVEVRYRDEPCPACGEIGACGYDTEGRALIHVTEDDPDVDA